MRYAKGKKIRLSREVLVEWAIKPVLAVCAIAAILYYLTIYVLPEGVLQDKQLAGLIIVVAWMISLGAYLGYTALRYFNYHYSLNENELVICHGVLNAESVMIPYVKIQNVNLRRSIFQRFLGTGGLFIDTAGKKLAYAEGALPSIRNYAELTDELVRRKEAAKNRGVKAGV